MTVTCSGLTQNQDPPSGYGNGGQSFDTINVNPGATVQGTSAGFTIGTNNIVNNNGTITVLPGGAGVLNGISTVSGIPLAVNNFNTISTTSTVAGGSAFGINAGDVTLANSGNITASATGGVEAIAVQGSSINVTSNSGTIAATGVGNTFTIGMFALNNLTIGSNTGTISGVDEALTALGAINVTNNAGGLIQGTGAMSAGILGVNTTTVNNAGTIIGNLDGINTNTSSTTTVVNSGTITGTTRQGIRVNTATVTNNPGGLITGVTGIFFRPGNGASSIFNAGTVTGTGGTAIQFSTGSVGNLLTLAPGFAINGTVLGAGSDIFQLGGTGNGTFDVSNIGAGQQYQGFSTFNKVDASTWILSGTGNQIWNVLGGVLGGNVTIGGLNVASGGTVAPGTSIGTMTVTGNVSFAPGSIYQVEANAAGQSDKIVAGGTTTLAGGTVQVLAANGNYAPSTRYTILTSAGGVFGTFSNVTSNLVFLTPSLSYDADDVFLTLTRTAGAFGTSFCNVAATINQCSVARALDQFPTTNPLFLAVLNQTAAGARQAFDALSGEIHATAQTTLIDDERYAREAVLGRLRQAAFAGPGPLAALATGGPMLGYADAVQGSELAYADPRMPVFPVKAPPPAPAPIADTVWWAQGLGAWGRIDSDGNAAQARRDLAGVFTGVDRRFDNWRLGVVGGYTNSAPNVSARISSANIDTAYVGGYAGATYGPWNLRSGAVGGFSTISTNRTIIFPGFSDAASARYDATTAQVFGEIGYGIPLGNIAAEPFGGLAYVHLNTRGFAETGGIAALTGLSAKDDLGYSTLGARAATTWILANSMLLTPRVSVAWQRAFRTLTPTDFLEFQTAGVGFTIAGLPIVRNAALVESGLDLRLTPNATVGVSYAGQLANSVRDHSVKGNFTWRF